MHNTVPELSLRTMANRVSEAFLELVFPRNCETCGGPVGESPMRFFCEPCSREAFYRVSPPCCRTCGFPYWGMVESARGCEKCFELEPIFDEGRTLILHKGGGRKIVHGIKYRGSSHLLEDVTRLARETEGLKAFVTGGVFVPVPLHKRKLRERGYNQSALIAEAFARAHPDAAVGDVLQRVRDTGTQTRLNLSKRRKNVRRAFAVENGVEVSPVARYILVDDVFTTGSTLNECASVLRDAGAERVQVLTLAHG